MQLRDLFPGYKVNSTRFSNDTNEVISNCSSYVLTEEKDIKKDSDFLYHLKHSVCWLSYTIWIVL